MRNFRTAPTDLFAAALHAEFPAIAIRIVKPETHVRRAQIKVGHCKIKGVKRRHDCTGVNLVRCDRRNGRAGDCFTCSIKRSDALIRRQDRALDCHSNSSGFRSRSPGRGGGFEITHAPAHSRLNHLAGCHRNATPWLGSTSTNDRLVARPRSKDPNNLWGGVLRSRGGLDLRDPLATVARNRAEKVSTGYAL